MFYEKMESRHQKECITHIVSAKSLKLEMR